MKVSKFSAIFFWIPEFYIEKDYTSGSLERYLVINFLKYNIQFKKANT